MKEQDWRNNYLDAARVVSTWSKDPSKQVGCVIVGDDGQILAQGFNGFPRGIEDSEERYEDRETKYKYVVHAEQNAIYNAVRSGTCLKGGVAYVVGVPICSECAKGLIQVGIKAVYVPMQTYSNHWIESVTLAQNLFIEAGVKYNVVHYPENVI